MLGVAMYITIQTLYKQGLNKTEIARATKHDWKSVKLVVATGKASCRLTGCH